MQWKVRNICLAFNWFNFTSRNELLIKNIYVMDMNEYIQQERYRASQKGYGPRKSTASTKVFVPQTETA